MNQNVSHAVMAQRQEARDSLDDFPTPPWATRALCERLGGDFARLESSTCWEPACNRGHMAKPLMEWFKRVDRSDIHDYGWGGQQRVIDFLLPWSMAPHQEAQGVDWVIANPPFRLAEQFALRALDVATVGVALFVRTAFLESNGRLERLFAPHPPSLILQFAERVVLHKGKLAPNGSTATAYCWVIWAKRLHIKEATKFEWIAPCRKRLERPEDYQEG